MPPQPVVQPQPPIEYQPAVQPQGATPGFNDLVRSLSPADWTILGGALALFVFSFFGWYGASYGYSRNGWHYFLTGIVPVLLGIAMAVHVVLRRLGIWSLPTTALPIAAWEMIVGGAAAVLVLIRVVAGDDVGGYGLDRKAGVFLALLAALALVAGGFVRQQLESADGAAASAEA